MIYGTPRVVQVEVEGNVSQAGFDLLYHILPCILYTIINLFCYIWLAYLQSFVLYRHFSQAVMKINLKMWFCHLRSGCEKLKDQN